MPAQNRMATRTRVDPANDFFAAEALPAGLIYRPDFLSSDDEAHLLGCIVALPLTPAPYKSYTARRRTASFGYSYDFESQRLNRAPELPEFLLPLRLRVANELRVQPERLTQALVTEYSVGTPLGWHRDTPEFENHRRRISGRTL